MSVGYNAFHQKQSNQVSHNNLTQPNQFHRSRQFSFCDHFRRSFCFRFWSILSVFSLLYLFITIWWAGNQAYHDIPNGLPGNQFGWRRQASSSSSSSIASEGDQQLRIVICAKVTSETPYLPEWIEFHRMQGVDKFVLYHDAIPSEPKTVASALELEWLAAFYRDVERRKAQNDNGWVNSEDIQGTENKNSEKNKKTSRNGYIEDIIEVYSAAMLLPDLWPSIKNLDHNTDISHRLLQPALVSDCVERYKDKAHYIMHIDVDEFVYSPKYDSIWSFLESQKSSRRWKAFLFGRAIGYYIPSVNFGSSGQFWDFHNFLAPDVTSGTLTLYFDPRDSSLFRFLEHSNYTDKSIRLLDFVFQLDQFRTLRLQDTPSTFTDANMFSEYIKSKLTHDFPSNMSKTILRRFPVPSSTEDAGNSSATLNDLKTLISLFFTLLTINAQYLPERALQNSERNILNQSGKNNITQSKGFSTVKDDDFLFGRPKGKTIHGNIERDNAMTEMNDGLFPFSNPGQIVGTFRPISSRDNSTYLARGSENNISHITINGTTQSKVINPTIQFPLKKKMRKMSNVMNSTQQDGKHAHPLSVDVSSEFLRRVLLYHKSLQVSTLFYPLVVEEQIRRGPAVTLQLEPPLTGKKIASELFHACQISTDKREQYLIDAEGFEKGSVDLTNTLWLLTFICQAKLPGTITMAGKGLYLTEAIRRSQSSRSSGHLRGCHRPGVHGCSHWIYGGRLEWASPIKELRLDHHQFRSYQRRSFQLPRWRGGPLGYPSRMNYTVLQSYLGSVVDTSKLRFVPKLKERLSQLHTLPKMADYSFNVKKENESVIEISIETECVHRHCSALELLGEHQVMCPAKFPYVGFHMTRTMPPHPYQPFSWCSDIPMDQNVNPWTTKIDFRKFYPSTTNLSYTQMLEAHTVLCPGFGETRCCDYDSDLTQWQTRWFNEKPKVWSTTVSQLESLLYEASR